MSKAAAVAAILLAFTATWAAESKDVQQVRDLLYQEQASYMKGDVDGLMACYAPDFVGYGSGPDPLTWQVAVIGRDSLRSGYGASAVAAAEWAARHPERRSSNEVMHVAVKGERALAVTRHVSSIADTTRRHTIRNDHQTVWLLRKRDGEWKIGSFIVGVTDKQTVWQMGPE